MLISTVSTADRTYGPVKNNDYLSKIVNKSYPKSALTRDQIMIGILRANYDSFRGGNVHFLKVGEKLTLPDEEVISQIDEAEATKTVNEHLAFFKTGKPGAFPAIPLPKVATSVTTKTAVEQKVDAAEEDVSSNKESDSEEENKLEPVQESAAIAEKETEESRTKLESLESEKTQQDEVLQSLEMQIKKLEEELESTASDEKKAEENITPSDEEVEKEESEPSSKASDKDSLEKSTISALENNLSSNTEAEVTTKEVEEAPIAEVEVTESAPNVPVAEEAKSAAVEEKVFVQDKVEEPKAVSKEVAETPEIESSSEDSNIPWWVWIIPLFLVPLLILGLIFKSKDRVSSTDLPQIKKPKKKTATKEVLHVDASEPVIKASSTVVEIDDAYEEAASQSSNRVVSASEQEVSLKIDMARAYLDMDYHDAAVEILNEVVTEGNAVQVERAREILARI